MRFPTWKAPGATFHSRGRAAHAIPRPPAGEESASPEESSRPPSPTPDASAVLKALGTCHSAAEFRGVASSRGPTALSELRNRGPILKTANRGSGKKKKKGPQPLVGESARSPDVFSMRDLRFSPFNKFMGKLDRFQNSRRWWAAGRGAAGEKCISDGPKPISLIEGGGAIKSQQHPLGFRASPLLKAP